MDLEKVIYAASRQVLPGKLPFSGRSLCRLAVLGGDPQDTLSSRLLLTRILKK